MYYNRKKIKLLHSCWDKQSKTEEKRKDNGVLTTLPKKKKRKKKKRTTICFTSHLAFAFYFLADNIEHVKLNIEPFHQFYKRIHSEDFINHSSNNRMWLTYSDLPVLKVLSCRMTHYRILITFVRFIFRSQNQNINKKCSQRRSVNS